MWRYDVGDKVFVKSDLVLGKEYETEDGCDWWPVNGFMCEYRGRTVTIEERCYEGCYRIKEDGRKWVWTATMFLPYYLYEPELEESDIPIEQLLFG